MHKVETFIYWNKDLVVESGIEIIEKYTMPNAVSECLSVVETTLEKYVETKTKELGTDKWSAFNGTAHLVLTVDGVEFARTGTTIPCSFKYIPQVIAELSIVVLRSLDTLMNDRDQFDPHVTIRGSHYGRDQFNKDKAFDQEVFKN